MNLSAESACNCQIRLHFLSTNAKMGIFAFLVQHHASAMPSMSFGIAILHFLLRSFEWFIKVGANIDFKMHHCRSTVNGTQGAVQTEENRQHPTGKVDQNHIY
jgi:hypothetical protein